MNVCLGLYLPQNPFPPLSKKLPSATTATKALGHIGFPEKNSMRPDSFKNPLQSFDHKGLMVAPENDGAFSGITSIFFPINSKNLAHSGTRFCIMEEDGGGAGRREAIFALSVDKSILRPKNNPFLILIVPKYSDCF